MTLDIAEFRKALGCFATGITVVTSRRPNGPPLGLTVNSFNSVSLAPPLVLFSLDRSNEKAAEFEASGFFAVNVLSEHQQDVSVRFSTDPDNRWENFDWSEMETGAPVIDGCLATFDCRTYAVHDGGDHLIFLGEVIAMQTTSAGEPLLYYRGRYGVPSQPR